MSTQPGPPAERAELVVEFEVAATLEHAFDAWTGRPSTWWPASHTRSGDPAAIVFESREGGRIYECDRSGIELDWGRVRVWERPTRLEYSWHHVFPEAEATSVEVSFTKVPRTTPPRTLIRILQTGFEALGSEGTSRRAGNQRGWTAVLGAFRNQLAKEDHHE